MSDWLLVAGDFTTYGGMDMANFALASYLGRTISAPDVVHIVSHRVAPELSSMARVRVHEVPRPLGMQRLGEPFLRAQALRWQKRLGSGRVVANGGNADARDVNWVHYVHAAYRPQAAGAWNGLRVRANHRRYLRQERRALRHSRVVICNSRRTAADVGLAGVEKDRTRVVYYGIDPVKFGPITPPERERARRALGFPQDRPMALFVGALGDRRKGFDTLFEAWRALCGRPDWDVELAIAGTGAELPAWQARAGEYLREGRMRFLGFRRDIPMILAACDLLIHPARYEAYGLAVHEALCRGLGAIVSASAGIAEQYPEDLHSLLLGDPDSPAELARRLQAWRNDPSVASRLAPFSARLRARCWDDMAREIVTVAGAVS